jgi:hypothetical protein
MSERKAICGIEMSFIVFSGFQLSMKNKNVSIVNKKTHMIFDLIKSI